MKEPAWTIIADDLTGACDTAAAFASRGWPTMVGFSVAALMPGTPIRVLSTASRALPPHQAVGIVEQFARVMIHPGDKVYKKIDSTLRGNPGAELHALAGVLSAQGQKENSVLVCPAFPQQGRTVRGGQVMVHGAPLLRTEFAAACHQTDLLQIFSPCKLIGLNMVRGSGSEIVRLLNEPGVYVADADTEDDLLMLAEAGERAGIRLYCGSAGLAGALAGRLPVGKERMTLRRTNRAVLVAAGSRSQSTARQVEQLRERGTVVCDICDLSETSVGDLAIRIANITESGLDVVITVNDLPWSAGSETRVAGQLGLLTRKAASRALPGGVILTGGDTAAAVFYALECEAFILGGEIQPGVVWGTLADGPFCGLPVVTKAGGFGEPDALLHALDFLRPEQTSGNEDSAE